MLTSYEMEVQKNTAEYGRESSRKCLSFAVFKECLDQFIIQWNLGYTSKSGLKSLDVELRGTYK